MPMGPPLSAIAAAVMLTMTLGLAPASIAAAQARTRVVLDSGEELIGVVDETAEDRFDLVLPSGERRTIQHSEIAELEDEPSRLGYGGWFNLGIAVGASWIIQPGPPGDDHGAGGELALMIELRPDSYVPYHLRLEAVLGGGSDAGIGTVAALSRLYLIGVDIGPLVDLRLGGHVGFNYFAPGYSRSCAPCTGEGDGEPRVGLDLESTFTVWPDSPFDRRFGRLEVGPHVATTWLGDLSQPVTAGQVGLRCAFLLA